MKRSQWRCVVEREGQVVEEKEGSLETADPFAYLDSAATLHAENGGTLAHISTTVSRALPYGEVKCSCTVTVSCPQAKDLVEYAAKAAFIQATQSVNAAMGAIVPGLTGLPLPQ